MTFGYSEEFEVTPEELAPYVAIIIERVKRAMETKAKEARVVDLKLSLKITWEEV